MCCINSCGVRTFLAARKAKSGGASGSAFLRPVRKSSQEMFEQRSFVVYGQSVPSARKHPADARLHGSAGQLALNLYYAHVQVIRQ